MPLPVRRRGPPSTPTSWIARPVVINSEGRLVPWELYGLTQMEYNQIAALFINFDSDDNGELDRTELRTELLSSSKSMRRSVRTCSAMG